MAGYLEHYGAAEERKAKQFKRIKRVILALLAVIAVGLIGWLVWLQFRNIGQEQDAKRFLQRLRDRQYRQAYAMFGCTEKQPCPNYSFDKFMEDWGPNSEHADQANAKIGLSQSCGEHVLLRIDYPKAEPVILMVDRKTDAIGFAPPGWVECPGKHWHFWRFIQSLFGKS